MKVYDIVSKDIETETVYYEAIPTEEQAYEIILQMNLKDVVVVERIVYNITGLGRDPDLHER